MLRKLLYMYFNFSFFWTFLSTIALCLVYLLRVGSIEIFHIFTQVFCDNNFETNVNGYFLPDTVPVLYKNLKCIVHDRIQYIYCIYSVYNICIYVQYIGNLWYIILIWTLAFGLYGNDTNLKENTS